VYKPIVIADAVVDEGGRMITNEIDHSDLAFQRFFRPVNFYARYSSDISQVPLSILNIPALSTIIHFAWAIGVDVKIGEIDKTYLDGLEKAKVLFRENLNYSTLSFNSKVTAEKVVPNTFTGLGHEGLMFNGGLDSSSSYAKRWRENPKLITVWGLDILLDWADFWKMVLKTYGWMNQYTVESNTEEIYYKNDLWSLGSKVKEGYRGGYQFSINTLGVCAPLTVAEGIGKLMLSSTYPSREYGDPDVPWGENRVNFLVDKCMRWANVETEDVECEYSTNEKVKHLLKPFFDSHGPLTIRSCGNLARLSKVKDKWLNCNICDKCQRVIGMLTVNGIDPNTCGFHVAPETYEKIKTDIINETWNTEYLKYHWEEIKRSLPSVITEDFNGSKDFLEWLRGYKFA